MHLRSLLLTILLAACTRVSGTPLPKADASPPEVASALRDAVLASYASCAVPHYERFAEDTSTLARATEAFARDGSAAGAVREAFRSVVLTWETLELYAVGPLSPPTSKGGRDLRPLVHSFPAVNFCFVDEAVAGETYETQPVDNLLPQTRGLAAFAYLFYSEGDGNACPPSSKINQGGIWTSMTPEERNRRKRRYAEKLAHDLEKQAATLWSIWDPARENFGKSLASTHQGPYATSQAALNAVTDALFFLDTVKDKKVATPVGLMDCPAAACPDAVEFPRTGLSKVSVLQNVRAARAILEGCDGAPGVLSLVRDVGALSLASKLSEQGARVEGAVESLADPTLEAAVVDRRTEVIAIHRELKTWVDLLRTEFVTVLDVELPQKIEGDND